MHGCYGKSGHEPIVGRLTGPRSKLLLLLNIQSIKLPSKFISLYSQISLDLKPHQRSFFVQWTVVNTELVKVQTKGIYLQSTGPQMGCLHHMPSREDSATITKAVQKDFQKLERTRVKQCHLDRAVPDPLHSWTHRSCSCLHKTCTKSSQSTVQPGGGAHEELPTGDGSPSWKVCFL
jgi:hypothetical protein